MLRHAWLRLFSFYFSSFFASTKNQKKLKNHKKEKSQKTTSFSFLVVPFLSHKHTTQVVFVASSVPAVYVGDAGGLLPVRRDARRAARARTPSDKLLGHLWNGNFHDLFANPLGKLAHADHVLHAAKVFFVCEHVYVLLV